MLRGARRGAGQGPGRPDGLPERRRRGQRGGAGHMKSVTVPPRGRESVFRKGKIIDLENGSLEKVN